MSAVIVHAPQGARRGKVVAECDDVAEAEALIDLFAWADPSGVFRGDYGIDDDEVETTLLCFTVASVGRALWTSDACPFAFSQKECEIVASYILKTCLGLRAMTDGGVVVDLGRVGFLTITHQEKT